MSFWEGVEKATVDKVRVFFNGFVDGGICDRCGGELTQQTTQTVAGLATVNVCEECNYTTFEELHDPTYQ